MAKVNDKMVKKVAEMIRLLPSKDLKTLEFIEPEKFPAVGGPGVLNYFFAVTMQDYGFWMGDDKGYVKPLYGGIDGKRLKGSDLLWTLSMKTYREQGPDFFCPTNLAKLEYDEFITKWLPEKYGFQDMITRWEMAVNSGKDIVSGESLAHVNLIRFTNSEPAPLASFLVLTSLLSGYDCDFLFK